MSKLGWVGPLGMGAGDRGTPDRHRAPGPRTDTAE